MSRSATAALTLVALVCSLSGLAGAATPHRAAPAPSARCHVGTQLVVGVSKGWTGPQVSGVNFALTNRSTACSVSGLLFVQLLGPKGGVIGSTVRTGTIHAHVIHETFQLVDAVELEMGPVCARQLQALALRIGVDRSSATVPLKAPLFVCLEPRFDGGVIAPAFPIPSPCTQGQVSTGLGVSQGATGNVITQLIVKNISKTACTVGGFPSVQGADGPSGALVGPPAAKFHPRGSGAPLKDLNHTGAMATATYEQANTGDFTAGRCEPATAPGIDVAVMGFSPEYLTYKVSMCTKFNSTGVTRIGASF